MRTDDVSDASGDPSSRLRRLDHVQLAMPAGGEADAVAFYQGALGLAEIPKPPVLAARGGCWFSQGDVVVHLGVDPAFTPATKAHPAFVVDDLDALAATLRAHGVDVTYDDALEGVRRGYVADPFGNRIELIDEAPARCARGAPALSRRTGGEKVTGRGRAMGCRPPHGQSRCPPHRARCHRAPQG